MFRRNAQKGSVTLETSVVLPIFIFMFLFIYGFFSIVSAQNQITHALIQSSKSLSLDSYLTENVESAAEAKTKFWSGFNDMALDIVRMDNNRYFSSQADWYKAGNENTSVVKDRFVGYFAGGDKNIANDRLKNLGIKSGLDGIDFELETNGEIITITIKYEIQYLFDFFGMGKIPMEQTIKSRMWM